MKFNFTIENLRDETLDISIEKLEIATECTAEEYANSCALMREALKEMVAQLRGQGQGESFDEDLDESLDEDQPIKPSSLDEIINAKLPKFTKRKSN